MNMIFSPYIEDKPKSPNTATLLIISSSTVDFLRSVLSANTPAKGPRIIRGSIPIRTFIANEAPEPVVFKINRDKAKVYTLVPSKETVLEIKYRVIFNRSFLSTCLASSKLLFTVQFNMVILFSINKSSSKFNIT